LLCHREEKADLGLIQKWVGSWGKELGKIRKVLKIGRAHV
jgi:hypothetical protein